MKTQKLCRREKFVDEITSFLYILNPNNRFEDRSETFDDLDGFTWTLQKRAEGINGYNKMEFEITCTNRPALTNPLTNRPFLNKHEYQKALVKKRCWAYPTKNTLSLNRSTEIYVRTSEFSLVFGAFSGVVCGKQF